MAGPSSFFSQANHLISSYQIAKDSGVLPEELELLQKNISALARSIIHSASPDSADAKEALSLIGRVTPNTYRSLETGLYLNLKDRSSPPAAPCTPYPHSLQTPFLASYHSGCGPYKLLARLDGEAVWGLVPKEIFDCLGSGLDPEKTDIFFIQSTPGYYGFESVYGDYYGGHYKTLQYELLLKFHQWAFPDLPHGADHHKRLFMGAFPEFGFYRAQHWPAPLGYMADMDIHAHPDERNTIMLYSPNGAHIAIDTKSPFGACWIAAREGDRCCIAKVLLSLYDPETGGRDPFFHAYFSLSSGCSSLEEYAKRMISFSPEVQSYAATTWQPFIFALEREDTAGANEIFYTMPRTFRSALFKQLWIIKGSPSGHDDFGKLCFEASEALAPELRATSADKIQAARQVQLEIMRTLITEPLELLEVEIRGSGRAHKIAGPASHLLGKTEMLAAPNTLPAAGAGSRAAIPAQHAIGTETTPHPHTPEKEAIDIPPLETTPATIASTYFTIKKQIEEIKAAIHAKRDQATLQELIATLDRIASGSTPEAAQASHRLFSLIYELHMLAKEGDVGLQEPAHSKFGEAAFYGIEGAKTHPEVIAMALDALLSELI